MTHVLKRIQSCNKFKTHIVWAQVFLLFFTACSSDSGGGGSSKKYRVTIQSSQCRQQIKEAFNSQAEVCEFLRLAARSPGCLYNELRREFFGRQCNGRNYNQSGQVVPKTNENTGDIIIDDFITDEDLSNGKNDLTDGRFPPPPESPTSNNNAINNPIVSGPKILKIEINQELYEAGLKAQGSIDDYFIKEGPSGCLARFKGTNDIIDSCDYSSTRSNGSNRTAEKDDPAPARTRPVARSGQTGTPSTTETSNTPRTEDQAQPVPKNQGNKLDYNLIDFNESNILITPVDVSKKINTLKIVTTIDPRSPIFGLSHTSSNLKAIEDLNVVIDCPLRSLILTSGNTISLTFLPDSESSEEQIKECNTFFANFKNLTSFEFKYEQPLVMTNGQSFDQGFKLQNTDF